VDTVALILSNAGDRCFRTPGRDRLAEVAGARCRFCLHKGDRGRRFQGQAFCREFRGRYEGGRSSWCLSFLHALSPRGRTGRKLPRALPPAVDLEFLGNCRSAKRMTPTDLHRELRTFLAIVEARTGKPALPYLTQEFDEAYAVSSNFDRPLWLRSIAFEPRFGSRPWTLWQASNFRRLDGITGRVDWNVARLTWPAQPPHSQS